MKELLEIIKAGSDAQKTLALATIVQTAGSSYRRAGARMLIKPDGRTIGCISGGCLDQDVVLQGLEVIQNQRPVLITYDTSSERDLLFGSGVGCQGIIEILLEPLRMPPEDNLLASLGGAFRRRCSVSMATVIATKGDIQLSLGDRVLLGSDGERIVQMRQETGATILTDLAQQAEKSREQGMVLYETSTGSARVFVESFFPPRNLIILGGGHDAMPLVRLASELGYRITVMDVRPEYVRRDRFPLADQAIIAHPDDPACPLELFDKDSVAVIMSHNYSVDCAWLKTVLPMGLNYIGLMGPRKRAEKMFDDLRQSGFVPSERQLQCLHNPIGLDVGAESPEQIALAIMAEIQAVLSRRAGGKLREKKGPIHTAPAKPDALFFEQSRVELLCNASA